MSGGRFENNVLTTFDEETGWSSLSVSLLGIALGTVLTLSSFPLPTRVWNTASEIVRSRLSSYAPTTVKATKAVPWVVDSRLSTD